MTAAVAVQLIARTPSGDAAFARDNQGRLWAIGQGDAAQASLADLDAAILHGGFEPVNRQFDSWSAMATELRRVGEAWLAAHPAPRAGFASYDHARISELLIRASRQAPVDDEPRLVIVAERLLDENSLAQSDPALRSRLLGILRQHRSPQPPVSPFLDPALIAAAQSRMAWQPALAA